MAIILSIKILKRFKFQIPLPFKALGIEKTCENSGNSERAEA
jgi:hypothetical protein